MFLDQSVCIFHNGNSRIIELYKQKFKNLKFLQNWTLAGNNSPRRGAWWEISPADITNEILLDIKSRGIKIIRHIIEY